MSLLLGVGSLAWALPEVQGSASFTLNSSLHKGFQSHAFSVDTADNYCPQCSETLGWLALRIPLANALDYAQVPAMLTVELQAQVDSVLEFKTVLPLQKDLEAWHSDPTGSNVILGANQVNINVPYESWAKWTYGSGFVQAGRFKAVIGPSPHSVVLGSAPPFHEALWWQQQLGAVRFDWMLLSLNPHLLGTPSAMGDSVPQGSEAWQQSHYSIPNQRFRSYNQPSKNLMLHRLTYEDQWGWLAIIEQSMIGGKTLSFKELNPFMAWHNNFGDGYTKASTTLELALIPAKNQLFYWQVDFEDIASPVGETFGEISPTTLGILAGWKAQWTPEWWTRLDAVYTDPSFNNHRIPLQKMTSRQMYRSNFRDQIEPAFADVYVMDYPLGYSRGPDAVDLWFTTQYSSKSRQWALIFEAAWLRQGEQELWNLWDTASTYSSALTGVVEEEIRVHVQVTAQVKDLQLHTGFGLRYIGHENHILGNNRTEPVWDAGVQYTIRSGNR